jgi:hypothetical protein
MKNSYSLAAVGCVFVLSACGGGGGDGGSSTPVQLPLLSAIAAADAPKAAGAAYTATAVLSGSSIALTDTLTGASVAPPGVSGVSAVLDLVKHAYERNGTSLPTGAALTSSCTYGGAVTIDASVRNQDVPGNGDTLTITAIECSQDGAVMNGKLSVTLSGVGGDIVHSTTGAMTLDARFNDFTTAVAGIAENLYGDMKIGLTATAADTVFSISGQSLQATKYRMGATVATRRLSSYSVTGNVRGSTVSATASFSVAGNADGLGQFAYTVKTPQPIVTTVPARPTSGSLIVTGADSSVTLTVVPNGVRVDYSAKSDGVVTQLSWSDFLANS